MALRRHPLWFQGGYGLRNEEGRQKWSRMWTFLTRGYRRKGSQGGGGFRAFGGNLEGPGSFRVGEGANAAANRMNVEWGAQNQGWGRAGGSRSTPSHLCFLSGEGNVSCLQVTEEGSGMPCRRGSPGFGTGIVGRESQEEGGGKGGVGLSS